MNERGGNEQYDNLGLAIIYGWRKVYIHREMPLGY